MTDYEYLFATTLHHKLKEKIKGRIFVEITNDNSLNVVITDPAHNFSYKIVRDNFPIDL